MRVRCASTRRLCLDLRQRGTLLSRMGKPSGMQQLWPWSSNLVGMRRMGRWFAVKMVGADVVGVVWLPKFPRTSAEFLPSAAATHVPASVISQCQVRNEKTSFHGLRYVGLCILSRSRMLPSPNFIQGTIFPRN